MSYCVNCGVELDSSIKKCPLCQTPVINPKDLEKLKAIQSPFPEKKGVVETINKKDMALTITVILLSILVSCTLLNYFVFNAVKWSLIVDGFCGLMWVLLFPPLVVKKPRLRILALLNGLMTGIYLGLIAMFVDEGEWLIDLGLPITIALILMTEVFLTVGKIKRSINVLGPVFFIEAGIMCIFIELLIDRMQDIGYSLSWSAIVMTVCTIVAVSLVSLFSFARIRNAINKRLHL